MEKLARERRRWHLLRCLVASLAIHLFVAKLGEWLEADTPGVTRVRLFRPIDHVDRQRYQAPSVEETSRGLERIRLDETAPSQLPHVGHELEYTGSVESGPLAVGELVGAKRFLAVKVDTLPDPREEGLPFRSQVAERYDPIEVHARGRVATTAAGDKAGKIAAGYLHLPAYRNRGECGYHGGRDLAEIGLWIERGIMLPVKAPVHITVRWRFLGPCSEQPVKGPRSTFSRFSRFPRRDVLTQVDLEEFPIVDLRYVDVESMQSLTEYLIGGGFAVLEASWFETIVRHLELEGSPTRNVEVVSLESEHQVFHSYYDVDAVSPLRAIKLGSRLVAVEGVEFCLERHCASNALFVNVLAFALLHLP